MPKKDNTALFLIIGAAAVAGYMYYKKGLTSAVPAQGSLNDLRQSYPAAAPQVIPGVATELPDMPDIGIIAPKLDPTGMQITLY